MNNKTYDAIKWIVVTVLPAASVFVAALGHIYGWGNTDAIVATLNAVAVFLGATMHISTASYNKTKENK
ncbi:holin [Lactococcus cremoris]|uniref:Phage holin n=1 Tax=Lactococcus lactis subsp. cremoris TaxID=1359 RepID=A0A1V0PGQ3_LACLC|nr:phage holin [Lactococcus cremoris]ARE28467.1 phage holin [Lactococcus cremoris]EUN33989.1 phage holin [Lactococcus cremoris subsp. cremoris HP]KZK09854.1 Phage holin [Lactococcus cremoris]KZK35153.1 Phage holin [Lactococcus cremoris]KZK52538.1 Phage holin [Lactococcus cremoris]